MILRGSNEFNKYALCKTTDLCFVRQFEKYNVEIGFYHTLIKGITHTYLYDIGEPDDSPKININRK